MSRFFATRSRLFVTLGVVGALTVAGAAYAYFTASGSGNGSARVGANQALTLHATSASSLYPGTSSAVSFTVDNPSTGHQQLGTIHLASVTACSVAFTGGVCTPAADEITTCESVETGASDTTTANFWMPDVASNQDFGPGNGQSVTAGGTVKMNDLSSNQNSCQGAYLQLNFTS